jgi:hypothetical protein
MYKEGEPENNRIFLRAKSINMRPSRLEQAVLPSAFHTEENNILKENKVDATIDDH